MTIESLPIETLHSDPANARLHSAQNLDAIKASLKRFGQQKPIVVDGNGIVRAGNGTLAAAKALGWKQINVVRTDLAGVEATAFAIADNRTTDLSEWDEAALAEQLEGLKAEGFDLSEIGFADKELDDMLKEETLGDERWLVLVTCQDEADQVAFLEEMHREGRTCKAMFA